MIKHYNSVSLRWGIPGVIIQGLGFIVGSPLMSTIGTLAFLIGLSYYAKAKGRHPAWCLLAIFSIFGLIALSLLNDYGVENHQHFNNENNRKNVFEEKSQSQKSNQLPLINGSKIKIHCPKCNATHIINISKIPAKGAYARCRNCNTQFFVNGVESESKKRIEQAENKRYREDNIPRKPDSRKKYTYILWALSAIIILLIAIPNIAKYIESKADPFKGLNEQNQNSTEYPDGKKYQGQMQNGEPHGKGTMTLPDGKKYEGQFKNGVFYKGIETHPNGAVFKGDFKGFDIHGYGEDIYSNGEKYIGQYKDGWRHGNGFWSDAKGNIYTGQFRNGEPDGLGTIFFPDDKTQYIGHFKKGTPNGNGILILPTGDKYIGKVKDSLPTDNGFWEYTEETKEKKPTAVDWYKKALAMESQGRLQVCEEPYKALKYINKAIELDPFYARAYTGKGLVYIGLKEYNKAIEAFNKAIKLSPNDPKYYTNRCLYFAKIDRWEKVIEDCNKAIQLDAKYVGAYSNRGGAYIKLGQIKIGCNDLKKACNLGDCGNLRLVQKQGICF